MSRRLVIALSAAGVIALIVTLALAEFVHGYGPVPWWRLTLDLGVGASFLTAGLIAWWRRPKNNVGRLLMAAGFAFLVGAALNFVQSPLTYTLRWVESSVYLAILVQLLFAFPSGRISAPTLPSPVSGGGKLERFLCVAAYADAVFGSLTTFIFLDPRTRGLPQGLNLLLVFPNQQLFNLADFVLILFTVALTLVILAVFVQRWGRASGPARRIIAPVGWSLALAGLAFIADTIISRQPSFPSWTHVATAVAQTGAVMLVPVGFLVGLLRGQLARSAVGDLVIELGATPQPGQLREMLAHTLHDPSLRLAYWIPEMRAYVDAGGTPVQLPEEGQGQAVAMLQHEGESVGVLVHDAALIEEPRLVEAVAAATGLALQNERLQAALRAQLEEIHASRARIVEAADAARRRIERDLHDGAQQRLVGVSLALTLTSSRLTPGADPEVDQALKEASQELAAALSELRELAHGIHPSILTEEGLGPALESLVERASIRVTLKTVPTRRLPSPVEAAAYFVVSEALANVAKYARATSATISADAVDERLVLDVSDDGIGGADPTQGSGLRGLADRVAALDGSLRIESAAGKGTIIHAEIPCA